MSWFVKKWTKATSLTFVHTSEFPLGTIWDCICRALGSTFTHVVDAKLIIHPSTSTIEHLPRSKKTIRRFLRSVCIAIPLSIRIAHHKRPLNVLHAETSKIGNNLASSARDAALWPFARNRFEQRNISAHIASRGREPKKQIVLNLKYIRKT